MNIIFWEPILWQGFVKFDNKENATIFDLLQQDMGIGGKIQFDYVILVLYVSLFLVFCGILGFLLNASSFLHLLVFSEVVLLGYNLLFLCLCLLLNDATFQVYSILLVCLSALDSCVGLALIYRLALLNNTISLFSFSKLIY